MTRLIVSYSHSAVLPRDLIAGLAWCPEVLFLVRPGGNGRQVPALLADLGATVEVGDDREVPWGVIRSFGADGIVTFSEDMLATTALVAAELGLPHSSRDTVTALRDKRVQRARLRAAGVDSVRTASLASSSDWERALEAVGLPLVLKPAHGAGSVNTSLVTEPAEGRLLCESFFSLTPGRPLVAEEYLRGIDRTPFGDYVSVESLVRRGKVTHLGVTGKLPQLPPFRETGQFYPSTLSAEEDSGVTALAREAIEALGIAEGAVHTEIKLTPEGPRIIEVNGRLGGYINELYTRVLGCDVIELVTRAACGQEVQVPQPRRDVLFFQYTHQPPPGALRVAGLQGAREVARHPDVSRYERLTPVAAEIPQDQSTHDLDLLCGIAPSALELHRVLDSLRSRLSYTFETATGSVTMSGNELAGDAPTMPAASSASSASSAPVRSAVGTGTPSAP